MQQSINRFNLALICVGFTLLLPLLLPFPYAIYDIVMSRLVSNVWVDLHFTANSLLKLLFVYGLYATVVVLFMVKLQIEKRLQPQYASTKLWSAGCLLVLVVIGFNLLIAVGAVAISPSDRQTLATILLVGKVILFVAAVHTLIGVLPRASSN